MRCVQSEIAAVFLRVRSRSFGKRYNGYVRERVLWLESVHCSAAFSLSLVWLLE